MHYWAQLTTTDFSALAGKNAIAVLPVAAIEQHGPHLPLGTDSHIAEGFLADAAEALEDLGSKAPKIICLPMQTIGHSPEHTDFAGTLSARAETFIDLWVQIGASVARAGVKKLLIINSHGGNSPLLDIVARRLRMEHGLFVVATHWLKLADLSGMINADELKYGVHGGMVETSLMLSIVPHLVRMNEAKAFPSSQQNLTEHCSQLRHYGPVLTGWMAQDLNPAGVVGNPQLASAELGIEIRKLVQKGFMELVGEIHNTPPHPGA